MAEEESSTFTTKRRSIGSDGELKWGGEDGEEWSEAVESSEGITVTDDGTITLGSDTPDSVVDDFERGDLTPWYGDGKSAFDATTRRPYDGSYSLDFTSSSTSTRAITAHPSENNTLPNYLPRHNLTSFRFYYGHHDNRCWFGFGISDYDLNDAVSPWNDGYSVRVNSSSETLDLFRNDTGELASSSASIPVDEWFEIQIDYGFNSSDTVGVEIFNDDGMSLGSVSATDEAHSGSGIGVRFDVNNSSDTKFWTDEIFTT